MVDTLLQQWQKKNVVLQVGTIIENLSCIMLQLVFGFGGANVRRCMAPRHLLCGLSTHLYNTAANPDAGPHVEGPERLLLRRAIAAADGGSDRLVLCVANGKRGA
jgi:hypothetical protein